jgi:hypothetical protein
LAREEFSDCQEIKVMHGGQSSRPELKAGRWTRKRVVVMMMMSARVISISRDGLDVIEMGGSEALLCGALKDTDGLSLLHALTCRAITLVCPVGLSCDGNTI